MKYVRLLTAVLMVLLWTDSGRAQRVYIDITQPSFAPISIAVPDFKFLSSEQVQLSKEMSGALAGDLEFSGIFRPLDPKGFLEDPQTMGLNAAEIRFNTWQSLQAEFLVRGAYQVQGNSIRLEARLFDVFGSKMILGKVYEGDARNWRAMIHRFADEILLLLTGERGVFDTKITFVQSQGKAKEIFVSDFDGGNAVQVTHDQNLNLSPTWSPDGTQIAYVSFKDGNTKIYAANLLDGTQRLLSGHPGLNIAPAWRPGSRDLAATLSRGGNPDIYLISSSGDILQKLVQGWSINVSPSWSPDGRKLAYVSNETGTPQIYVLDVGSGQKRRITFSGNYNTSPAWSPKGDWIAYSGSVGGRHNIFIIKPDGSDVRQLTRGEGDNESPTWSPDGRMIAFSSTRQGGSAIWMLLTNGAGTRRVTRMPGSQELPDWSPRLGGR
ncbi:MAG TPA: Tol-Pal system beta propeller repeat protein TolB [Syntrophobacteraceae bacterium]|nr:Tol-Pal system beta propeller repeat protein TolB [Syntrophobacteraceae bacterium]